MKTMKTLSVLLLVALLLGLAVEVTSAASAPVTVVLGANRTCSINWSTGGALGSWRLRWNYYNGNYNLTYYCDGRLSWGRAPSTTLHFWATNQPWCNIQNQGVVSTNGQTKWTCQGKYSG